MAEWHHRCNEYELRKLQEMVRDREVGHAAGHSNAKSQTRLGDQTTTTTGYGVFSLASYIYLT